MNKLIRGFFSIIFMGYIFSTALAGKNTLCPNISERHFYYPLQYVTVIDPAFTVLVDHKPIYNSFEQDEEIHRAGKIIYRWNLDWQSAAHYSVVCVYQGTDFTQIVPIPRTSKTCFFTQPESVSSPIQLRRFECE